MALILINILIITAWVLLIRWRVNDYGEPDKSGYIALLAIASLLALILDLGIDYKEIRREPVKMLQVEWDDKKYEGYTVKTLKEVDEFTPPPHERVIYSNFFGVELNNK